MPATIERPDNMSVSELREWLSKFGQEQKSHYESNKVTKQFRPAGIQHKIRKFEQRTSCTSSSSTATTLNDSGLSKKSSPWQPSDYPETIRVIAVDEAVSDVTVDHNIFTSGWHPGVHMRQQEDNARQNMDEFDEDDWMKSLDSALYTSNQDDDLLKDNDSASSRPKSDDGKEKGCCLTPKSLRKSNIYRKLPLLLCKSEKQAMGIDAFDDEYIPSTGINIWRDDNDEDDDNNGNSLANFALSSTGKKLELFNDETSLPSEYIKEEKVLQFHNTPIFKDQVLTSDALDLLCKGKITKTEYPCYFSDETSNRSIKSIDSGLPSVYEGALTGTIGDVFGHERLVDVKRRASREPVRGTVLQCPPACPTRVSTAVRKFDPNAPKRSSAVLRRKEQLEKKFAESKEPVYTKKVAWQSCKRSGTYKKQVVLDVSK